MVDFSKANLHSNVILLLLFMCFSVAQEQASGAHIYPEVTLYYYDWYKKFTRPSDIGGYAITNGGYPTCNGASWVAPSPATPALSPTSDLKAHLRLPQVPAPASNVLNPGYRFSKQTSTQSPVSI